MGAPDTEQARTGSIPGRMLPILTFNFLEALTTAKSAIDFLRQLLCMALKDLPENLPWLSVLRDRRAQQR